MYNRLLIILALLLAFMACSNVVYAQSENSCQGGCEWEVMMKDMLSDYTAISKYDYQDKISRADMHHLSYMTNMVTQLPLTTCEDPEVTEHYVRFIKLLIREYANKADYLKEMSVGREMVLSGTLSNLLYIITIIRNTNLILRVPKEYMSLYLGNLHLLERELYGNDIVMAEKDPYYATVLNGLCEKLGIRFNILTAEDDLMERINEMISYNDKDALLDIWKDIIRFRFCVSEKFQGQLDAIMMTNVSMEVGIDAFISERGRAMRECFPEEVCKIVIPVASLRLRTVGELANLFECIQKHAGKKYAKYLPWKCPPQYRTKGFEDYREAFMKMSKFMLRSIGYEMSSINSIWGQETAQPLFDLFEVSNIHEFVCVIGAFGLELIFEGYNDAYTIIEDVYRIACTGMYDPYLMAKISLIYTEINFSKVEEIIDNMLIPSIADIKNWTEGSESMARYDAMLMASYAGLIVNKDKYLNMVEEYIGKFRIHMEKRSVEEIRYLYPILSMTYSYMGMGEEARKIINCYLDDGSEKDKNTFDFAMFESCYYEERYEAAMQYIDSSLKTTDMLYSLHSMVAAFRTDNYEMAEKLSDKYLHNRYLMTENLLMATHENKSELYDIIRKYDVDAFSQIVGCSFSHEEWPSLLASLIYDWNLISKGSLLRSLQNWHNYMLKNNDAMYGTYDLFQAYAGERDDSFTELQQGFASIASYELSDVIRNEYEEWQGLPERTTFRHVARKLKKGEYAVEFCSVGDEYYAAVVGKGYRSPMLYRLCSREDMAAVSEDMFSEYLYGDIPALKELYGLVWAPLLKDIPEGSDIYCSLDGVLNLLNIELLCDEYERYVGDVYDIHLVSTTASITDPVRLEDIKDAVFYGNLNYCMTSTEISADSDKYLYDAAAAQYRGAVMDYIVPREYLKDTGEEIRSAAELLEEKDVNVLKFEWNDGTEFSFKSLSGKDFDVLHLATHGFWWGTDTDESGKYIPPMNRSGIVLSGSEDEPLSSEKAGVLFAQEISELDLSSVGLLVLSACQTAGGEILEDGVFGMQRGFKQAGVGTIVMTLWPVNSAMTQSFMTGFYAEIARGHDARTAFYNTRNDIRKVYPEPSDWGAFVILD